MKRVANGSKSSVAKARPKLPYYTDAEPVRDDDGAPIWPASAEAINKARNFIKEWYVTETPISVQMLMLLQRNKCRERSSRS